MKKKFIIGILLFIILIVLFLNITNDREQPPDKKEPIVDQLNPYRSVPQSTKLTEIPEDADIIFVSARHMKSGDKFNHEVFTVREDGTGITQITFSGHSYQHAAVAPFDKRYIVVMKHLGDFKTPQTAWILDIKTQTEWRLLPNLYSSGIGGVDWDQQGNVYFAAKKNKGETNQIYKVKFDGSEMQEIVNTDNSKHDVSVSEDGSLIAYNQLSEDRRTIEIWVANTDGSNQRRVTTGSPLEEGFGPFPPGHYDPEISPDNTKVIYGATSDSPNNCFDIESLCSQGALGAYNVEIINIDGTNQYKLTDGTGAEAIPDWHNGKILFGDHNQAGEDNNGIGFIGLIIMDEGSNNKKIIVKGECFSPSNCNIFNGGRQPKWIP